MIKILQTHTMLKKSRFNEPLRRIYLLLLLCVAVISRLPITFARPWPSPKLYATDPSKDSIITERENSFRFTKHPSFQPTDKPSVSVNPSRVPTIRPSLSTMPSLSPSTVPSSIPTLLKSESPSFFPTSVPSEKESTQPTTIATSLPSFSLNPSVSPTTVQELSDAPSFAPIQTTRPSDASITRIPVEEYPIDVPKIIDGDKGHSTESYFNYNPYDINFGPGTVADLVHEYNMTNPDNQNETITKEMKYKFYNGNGWSSVRNSYEYKYWNDFEGLDRAMGNKCEGGPTKKQSPIDLCETHVNAECFEHHQIRNRGGAYNLNDTQVELKILPSKLRIEYSRENDLFDVEKEHESDESLSSILPPRADFAHNWNGYIPVVHIDIKIPSEHTICGRRYAGEYQIYFYHAKRRLPIVQSVLIEIHPHDRRHKHFQKLLNEWQAISDNRRMECLNKKRKAREAENRFLRRMHNFVVTGIDSGDISLAVEDTREGGPGGFQHRSRFSHNEEHNLRYDLGMSTIFDEPQESRKILQNPAKKVEDPANYPGFESPHDGLNLSKRREQDHTRRAKKQEPTPSVSPSTSQVPSPTPSSAPTFRPKWNPFHPRIVNSIYFYGYRGSLTEPPCSEWVSWRVLDKPMQISSQQLMQIQDILFGQVDGDCKRTSVHWKGSVARPTQSFNDRPLWKCTPRDYLSDVDKANNKSSKS